MTTQGYLLSSESQENSSFVCLQPRISQTQVNCAEYTSSFTQQVKSPKVTAFSYSVMIDLKPKYKQIQTKTRKNAADFANSKRNKFFQGIQGQNNKITPFRNRKDLQKKAVEQKLKEIRKKKELAQILQGNVKRWLIIKQIPTSDKQKLRAKSQNSVAEPIQKNKHLDLGPLQNEGLSAKKKQLKMQLQKDKMNLYLKKAKKQKICKKMQSTHYQSGKVMDQLFKLRIQNNSLNSTIIVANKNSIRKSNLLYTRSSLRRQRQTSSNSSKMRQFSPSPEMTTTQDVQAIKNDVSQNALKCKKIDIKDQQVKARPQTAVMSQKIVLNKLMKAKSTVQAKNGAREMTGWQDLTDSYERQIYF